MTKKIFAVCIAIILLASIAAVSAVTDDHEDTGVTYTVPDGYSINNEYPSFNNVYDSYGDGTVYNYTNGTHNLKIVIFDLTNPLSSIDDIKDDLKGERKAIAGVEGCYKEYKNYVQFYCIKDGKLLRIDAPNEGVIEEVLSGSSSTFNLPFDIKIPNII